MKRPLSKEEIRKFNLPEDKAYKVEFETVLVGYPEEKKRVACIIDNAGGLVRRIGKSEMSKLTM